MSTTPETQLEFWPIDWYECRMTQSDFDRLSAVGPVQKRPGDLFWRASRSIGPCYPEHHHWGGDLLQLTVPEAAVVSVAPAAAEVCHRYVELFERHAAAEDYAQLYRAAKQVVERRREIESIDEQSTDAGASS